ncbi:hypothetical protein AGMMS49983_15500 [Clostridia bacterium]|nr:hypothetical protein AGMMS49983_15500 [Clostridia bacterium]
MKDNNVQLCKFIVLDGDEAEGLDDANYIYDEKLHGYLIYYYYTYNKATHKPDVLPIAHEKMHQNLPTVLTENTEWVMSGRVDFVNGRCRLEISEYMNTIYNQLENSATTEQLIYVQEILGREFNL